MPESKYNYHTVKIRERLAAIIEDEMPHLSDDYPGLITGFADAVRLLLSEAVKNRESARQGTRQAHA